ncbi:MAG: NADAR family protein [Euryarchaeota archaeon]|nr:NADAR family protein [Euryarchaeota archaeon]MDE1836647.1 NADAR family protein [Euryarchaeota archaeon]MDE1880324.1 NADAR family protein [Euryarchaeota archaeon]MDE2044617.1 NADAR family protein [Thermoplasmata archaeon]
MASEPIQFYRAAGEYGFLSNLYPCAVKVDIPAWTKEEFTFILAASAEHAYQWAKARDPRMRADILTTSLPRSAAILGHGLFPFDVVPGWSEKKVDWMNQVLRAKFSDARLKAKLLDTGDAPLVEASKTDAFWGIGKKGDGKNMLGAMLKDLRAELRRA